MDGSFSPSFEFGAEKVTGFVPTDDTTYCCDSCHLSKMFVGDFFSANFKSGKELRWYYLLL